MVRTSRTPDFSVITWRWKPPLGYRSKFGPETVNILFSMVKRQWKRPFRFILLTDEFEGLHPDIEIIPLDPADPLAALPSPHGKGNPSCYRRLRMFSRDARDLFGERFVSMDLDTVITGPLRHVWDRPEDFVMWGDTNPTTYYNGSMALMTAGARAQVWEDFDPARSPALARNAGFFGSDQGWISYKLGPGEAKWTKADGVLSYRNEIRPRHGELPPHARVVFFHGQWDPWHPDVMRRHDWVREHYR